MRAATASAELSVEEAAEQSGGTELQAVEREDKEDRGLPLVGAGAGVDCSVETGEVAAMAEGRETAART